MAIIVIGTLALVAGSVLGFAIRSFRVETDPMVDRIDIMLPQSQCAQCGYPGCRPYAEAIVKGASINKCVPGGKELMSKIADQLNIDLHPMEENTNRKEKNNIYLKSHVVWIDESNCIGCTKCIQACPVDAIVGTKHVIHTVISDFCTGCDLCISPCPTDCIKIRSSTIT